MKGYWLILGTAITDPAAQEEYGRLWAPIAAQYGAMLVREPKDLRLLEGRDTTARVLLVEFPDLASAQACYDDPAYVVARAKAHEAARRDLVIFAADLG